MFIINPDTLLTYHQGLYKPLLHEQSCAFKQLSFEFPKGRETVRKWTEAELTSRTVIPHHPEVTQVSH